MLSKMMPVTESTSVCCIGAGNVGRSWAIKFAMAGCSTSVYDPSPEQLVAAKNAIDLALNEVRSSSQSTDSAAPKIRFCEQLDDALEGALYVQESVPEDLQLKRQVYRQLENLIGEHTVIGSSTSEIAASELSADLFCQNRLLVAHPLNPPHLIPLVELCPSPHTEQKYVDWALAFFESLEQKPVLVREEISGFIANRLQLALLAEAINLAATGVCSVADIDSAVTDGLARRWIFYGPLETAQLNSSSGFKHYIDSYRSCHRKIVNDLDINYDNWTPAAISNIDKQLSEQQEKMSNLERQMQRDRQLLKLTRFLDQTKADHE